MKKENLLKTLMFSLLITTTSSCALIISGEKQKITFHTVNTDGAKIYSNYEFIGQANTGIKIPRHNLDQMFTIKKDGCKDTSFVLPVTTNYLIMLDMINPIGLMFDYCYGTQFKSKEKIIDIELDCD